VPLPWVRLDTAFPHNQKLLALLADKDGYRAALVYLCGLAHCGAQGSDGFITAAALPFIHGRPSDAKRLVDHAFWIPRPGGWLVHDWEKFQESNAETQERRKRAQHAAESRWGKLKELGDPDADR
jgi:hypothetical protein